MKTSSIAKILATAALASLGLATGTSQADNFGFHARVNAPAFDRPGFDGSGFGPGFGPAFCPPKGDAIDQRQRNQMERIEAGIRSGQLTRQEARELVREQRRIEHLQRRYLADGHLDRGEWADLDRRLDDLSRDIRAEKHDYDHYGPDRHAWR